MKQNKKLIKIKGWVVVNLEGDIVYAELKRKFAYQLVRGLMVHKNEWRKYFKVVPCLITFLPEKKKK